MTHEDIARVAHEVNRAYCQSLGDYSQMVWDESPDWQQKSAIQGVSLHLESNISPQDSHANWMRQKQLDGWKYGPEKNPTKKEHPCMLPYRELTPDQKAKDFIFKAVVSSLMKYFKEPVSV